MAKRTRLPKGMRKHIRKEKARLRREFSDPIAAKAAVEEMMEKYVRRPRGIPPPTIDSK